MRSDGSPFLEAGTQGNVTSFSTCKPKRCLSQNNRQVGYHIHLERLGWERHFPPLVAGLPSLLFSSAAALVFSAAFFRVLSAPSFSPRWLLTVISSTR